MSGFEMPWSDGIADYLVDVEVTGRYIPATYYEPADYPTVEITGVRLDGYGRRSKLDLTDWHRHERELQRDADVAANGYMRDAASWRGQPEGYDEAWS